MSLENNTWFRSTKVIPGIRRELQGYMGLTPAYDTLGTLNAHYNVRPSDVPTALPTVRYFGIGIGGNRNISDTNRSVPQEVSKHNMNLYKPIPFRAVPVEQDLTAVERANYRMRVIRTINGNDYALYYLKSMVLASNDVKITKTDPVTGLETDYTIDYTNLTPVPPTVDINGNVTDEAKEVNVTSTASLIITGAEVTEAISVLYGDLSYAKISEIGVFSGQDKQITVNDATGTPFVYAESILTQMEMHFTWDGDSFANPSKTANWGFRFGTSDILMD